MTVHLFIGFAGTGKDTLHQHIQAGIRCSQEEPPKYIWQIYALPDRKLPVYRSPSERAAFADALKAKVATNLKLGDWRQYESQKNTLMIDGKTLRQHNIDFGQAEKKRDPLCWCKEALEPYIDIPLQFDIDITDARFPREIEYTQANFAEVDTTRVYRSEVKEAPPTGQPEDPEHSLDDYATNYLLVRSEEEFRKAVVRFPQYTNYVRIGYMSGGLVMDRH